MLYRVFYFAKVQLLAAECKFPVIKNANNYTKNKNLLKNNVMYFSCQNLFRIFVTCNEEYTYFYSYSSH